MRVVFLLVLMSFIANANNAYLDTISYSKVKKLVKKEEQLAVAYKSYIRKKGLAPSIDNLINTNGFLPLGFSKINLFGKEIKILTTSNQIEDVLPTSISVKSNVYDYYYSDKYREYTKAPLSNKNNNVNIILDSKEKYILKFKDKITTNKSLAINKYYLDDDGILHWYDASGSYKFTYGKDLIVDKSLGIPGSVSFESFFNSVNLEVGFAGQTTFYLDDKAEEYLNLGEEVGYVKVGENEKNIGETIIQFTRRSGGMIVNGDIYTWGNNANRIAGINKNKYYTTAGSEGNKYGVFTGLIRAKAKVYDDNSSDGVDYSIIHNKKYFSSPLRPKFIDFFSTVYHGTCGISTKGELYCGGSTSAGYSFGNMFTHTDYDSVNEMLYRSRFFDGIHNKASKIFANNQIWLILGENGRIYRWGFDWSGFSGNGSTRFNYYNPSFNTNKDPEALNIKESGTQVTFKDITYLLTIGYRKMGALSSTGDVYIWGIESQIAYGNCSVNWQGKSMNLCKPLKVDSSVSFESLKGGLEAFVGLGDDGKYYKIHQPRGYKPLVISIDDLINAYTDNSDSENEYNSEDDAEIIAVDLSSKLVGSNLVKNEGIVWINGKNQLKGDYFTSNNRNDEFFKAAIKKIKWKDIKVIEDDNGMCGIDIYNQMYCWGIMSYYRTGSGLWNNVGNTFMLPVFNTNLYDLDKDYMLVEGGYSGSLTTMTSGEWVTTDSKGNAGAFFMKYPTYIGGFNYEFIFK